MDAMTDHPSNLGISKESELDPQVPEGTPMKLTRYITLAITDRDDGFVCVTSHHHELESALCQVSDLSTAYPSDRYELVLRIGKPFVPNDGLLHVGKPKSRNP